MKQWLAPGLGLLVISTTILSLAGYLGQLHYVLDLTAHFKLQYLIMALLALLLLSLTRSRKWIGLGIGFGMICVGLNLWAIVPWYLPAAQSVPASPSTLRVLLANVNAENSNYSKAIDLIRDEQPDVVAIVETNLKWLNTLQAVEDVLPYSLQSPRAETFGIALYSKFPLTLEPVETFEAPKDYHLVATVNQGDRSFVVVALHPPPPRSKTLFEQRNRELIEIGDYIKTVKQPVVAIGDLNITMWSPNYHEFVNRSELKNTRKGFGLLPTWNTYHPLSYIPIDHVMVSSEIQVIQTWTGRNIRSDHLPVIADLVY